MTNLPRIAVYAGHGGSDFGATANGLREKDLNLAVSNAATNILRGWGYTVLNNRTTDVDRSITRDANLANDSRVDALVEIHMNSNPGTPGTGTEAFVSIRDTGRARTLAGAILNRVAALGFANRGVKTQVNAQGQDAFGILRLTNMPAVLLECAFINNPTDMARFDANAMARAVAEGIREVFPISGGGSGGGGMPAFPGTSVRVGDRGESVRQIQACLNRVSLRHPSIQRLTEDGIFGPRTFDAVVAFQRIFGLSPDGVVGPLTWARLQQECNAGGGGNGGGNGGGSGGVMPPFTGGNLQLGSRGESVRQVQHCLNHVSQPCSRQLTEDGAFGPLTQAAVINFQRIYELTANGIVGPVTWARLAQECGGGTTPAFADADIPHEGCTTCAGHDNIPSIEVPPENGSGNASNLLLPLLLMHKLIRR